MGGHGGLNILPQKKWNVYRRDNRAKVARDELEHKIKQEKKKLRHQNLLLKERIEEVRSRASRDVVTNDEQGLMPESQCDSSQNGFERFELFTKEEEVYKKRQSDHKKYLNQIGHDEQSRSAFDSICNQVQPWYCVAPAQHPDVSAKRNCTLKSDVSAMRPKPSYADLRTRRLAREHYEEARWKQK